MNPNRQCSMIVPVGRNGFRPCGDTPTAPYTLDGAIRRSLCAHHAEWVRTRGRLIEKVKSDE